ncbi:unnamed protein product [Effrenium voratum]|nr:unnamed protein product [Effrenium voratum]
MERAAQVVMAVPLVPFHVVHARLVRCVILPSPTEDVWMWVKDFEDMTKEMTILQTGNVKAYRCKGQIKWLVGALVRPTRRESESACPWCSREPCRHNACSRSNFACRFCHFYATGHCFVNLKDQNKL